MATKSTKKVKITDIRSQLTKLHALIDRSMVYDTTPTTAYLDAVECNHQLSKLLIDYINQEYNERVRAFTAKLD
jgi:hypothetical protein